jgi:hypothetical protein
MLFGSNRLVAGLGVVLILVVLGLARGYSRWTKSWNTKYRPPNVYSGPVQYNPPVIYPYQQPGYGGGNWGGGNGFRR